MFAFAARRSVAPIARLGIRANSTLGKHQLPPLPYEIGALEPYISGQIMETHYAKHHQTYVNNLNKTEVALGEAVAKADDKAIVSLQKALNFNAGGVINHTLFWYNMAPPSHGGGELGNGSLRSAIERDFGSLDKMKEAFNAQLAGIQGSGWTWLVLNPTTKKLDLLSLPNQDIVINQVPIIGIDAWEHAYYLQYKNDKGSFFKNIWNVINYEEAQKRLDAAL